MAAPDPREAWNRLQTELARRSQRFGGAGGGPPKGLGGGVAALALVVGGVFVANNALFNGTSSFGNRHWHIYPGVGGDVLRVAEH